MKFKILIIIGFILVGCKSTKFQSIQYTNNCFYISRGYTYLNFYNSSDHNIFVTRLFIPRNRDLTIIENYYKLKNDTLYIRTPTKNDISASDTKNKDFFIVKDSIEIKKGKSIHEIFKFNRKFKIVALKDGNDEYFLKNCDGY